MQINWVEIVPGTWYAPVARHKLTLICANGAGWLGMIEKPDGAVLAMSARSEECIKLWCEERLSVAIAEEQQRQTRP